MFYTPNGTTVSSKGVPDHWILEYLSGLAVEHHKTGEMVWLPLSDAAGDLFPELTAYLDGLERIGVPVVLTQPKAKGSPAKPFLFCEARKRAAKRAASRWPHAAMVGLLS